MTPDTRDRTHPGAATHTVDPVCGHTEVCAVGVPRRSFLAGAGALALAFAAAACGAPTTLTAPAAGARTLTHKFGTTVVSGSPSRVVTVGLTDQDYAIALGVVPVGVRDWFGDQPGALWPWARAKASSVPAVLPVDQLAPERIAALNPDLILGVSGGLTRQEYDTLSRIAPTVAQPGQFADYGAPWQTITNTVGTALGKPEQAAALVPAVEKRFAEAKAAHPEFAGRTGLLAARLADGSFYVYAEGPAPRFLTDLGLTLPPATAALFTGPGRAPVQLSREQLGLLAADVLVVGLYGPEPTITDPLFTRLPTVEQGRAIELPQLSAANGAMTFGSVLSLPAALDEMVPRIAAALAGAATPPA